ncbi:MAG: hypothetical protein K0S04_335 [Herbinix sp.]|jgi:hypothetical protein|nr:hypothetical protein [Herbinix sp.]
MADKNDVVILNLDRPRMVWFGHKALKTLCAMTGATMNTIGALLQTATMEDIEKVMYCGLLTDACRNKEDLKLDDMEELLDLVPFSEITDALSAAMESSMGGGDEEKNNQGTVKKPKK